MTRNKYFIITVDTEGENGWTYRSGDRVHTENSLYIPRFQELCDKFGFKPVYLTNYEMASDMRFVQFARNTVEDNRCEVGIHVHAWNNPPQYDLPVNKTWQSYLIEYPVEVMKAKFKETYDLIRTNIGVTPVSHRAGRWAMNDDYFRLLEEFDIMVDCSHSPHVDWRATIGASIGGSDYRNVPDNSTRIGNILEVPVTIRDTHTLLKMGLRARIKWFMRFKTLPHYLEWLRPATSDLQTMSKLIDGVAASSEIDFAEFMIHSSELMPGGSPYFADEESIEKLYGTMESLFSHIKTSGFRGCTLSEYLYEKNKSN